MTGRPLTPKQAEAFCRREERRMQQQERERLDPHLATTLRQIVKVAGKDKVLAFVGSL